MENQTVEERSDVEQSSYRIVTFQGPALPPQYRPLILSKWLRSLKFGNDYFRLIDNNSYFKHYQRYITSLIARPEVQVKLAVLSDDSDVVLGFSVIEGTVLHYIHVHRDQRQQGIGKSLLPQEFKKFSHITKTAMYLWSKYPNVIFDPFA